jgi:hypothetical protein
MVVVAIHSDSTGSAGAFDDADAVLTVFGDGHVRIDGDGELVDLTLPVRCRETRAVTHFWDDPQRWARSLPRHAHYRGELRATVVVDVTVPAAPPGDLRSRR